MPYFALYRQWRPKDFSHIVGQRAIIDTLRNQVIQERIAHAYLFCGSRGTGKTSTAKILARAINCEHPVNGDPCGTCANCLRMEREDSLDITEIDAASNNGVDEMRDLRDSVKYPPQYGKYRVYIIDEVHMLSTSAFNALLKTLEEPPAHIVFILATTEPQKLPETILSRCQRFDFGRISVTDIQKRLREAADGAGASVSDGALMVIARAAEGGMRDALSMLDMCLGYGNQIDERMVRGILGASDQSFLFRFVHAIGEENPAEMFQMVDQLMREGRDPSVFIRDISNHIRTLLLASCCPEHLESILEITQEDAAEFIRQAGEFTVTRLMNILDLYMNAENELRLSAFPRLALENVCLKCCIRTTEPDMQALNDRILLLERRIGELENALNSGTISRKAPEKPQKTEPAEKQSSSPQKTGAGEPASEPSGANADFSGVWKAAMKKLQSGAPSVWSMLTQGNAACGDGQHILWTPARQEGAEFFISTFSKEDKKAVITDCLREITGREYDFQAAAISKPAAAAGDPDSAYIEQLYQTFGKEPVDVVEKL